jgi:hypothetical protein
VANADAALNLTLESCGTAAGGSLTRGLLSAVEDVIDMGQRLAQRKYAANVRAKQNGSQALATASSLGYNFTAELASPDFLAMRLLTAHLLPAVEGHIAQVYYDTAQSKVTSFRSFLIMFPCIFLPMLVLATLMLYRPYLISLNQDVERKRALLLLLPPVLLLHVPHLRSIAEGLTNGGVAYGQRTM